MIYEFKLPAPDYLDVLRAAISIVNDGLWLKLMHNEFKA